MCMLSYRSYWQLKTKQSLYISKACHHPKCNSDTKCNKSVINLLHFASLLHSAWWQRHLYHKEVYFVEVNGPVNNQVRLNQSISGKASKRQFTSIECPFFCQKLTSCSSWISGRGRKDSAKEYSGCECQTWGCLQMIFVTKLLTELLGPVSITSKIQFNYIVTFCISFEVLITLNPIQRSIKRGGPYY